MNEPRPKPKPLAVSGSDAAPIIYLDGVIAWGINNGVVQIETAANELVPNDAGTPGPAKVRTVVTSHIRCSIPAARELRDMLDAALKSTIAVPNGEKPN